MTDKEKEISVFSSLAETMMFCGEDGENMREDILKIKKTITAIAPAKKKGSGGPEMLDSVNAEELRNDENKTCDHSPVEDTNGYKNPYNTVPRVVQ